MSSRTETLTARRSAVDYRILTQGTLQVPVDPLRKELSLKDRVGVADHNTDPKHVEGAFWGFSQGCHTENPRYLIPPQNTNDGRIVASAQPAPYFERAVLAVATSRPQPPPESLLSPSRSALPTTLAGDLSPDTRKAYTALKLAGFETAVSLAKGDETPVWVEHNAPFVSNGRKICRTVPDPHATVGMVDRPVRNSDYQLPTAHAVEQELLTPELVTAMSTTLSDHLRDSLTKQQINPEQILVVPRMEEPRGPSIQYLSIDESNITDPESIALVSAVSKAEWEAYQQVIFRMTNEVIPDTFARHGEIYTPIGAPAYRTVMHMNPEGNVTEAMSPILVESTVGGLEACGVQIQRDADYPRRHTAQTVYQYRQETGRNMRETLANLR